MGQARERGTNEQRGIVAYPIMQYTGPNEHNWPHHH